MRRLLFLLLFLSILHGCAYGKAIKFRVLGDQQQQGPHMIDTEVAKQHADLMRNPSESYIGVDVSTDLPTLPIDTTLEWVRSLPSLVISRVIGGNEKKESPPIQQRGPMKWGNSGVDRVSAKSERAATAGTATARVFRNWW